MSNKIYRAEWTGKKTGWAYRLDVCQASEELLNNPEIIMLPDGCVKWKKGSWAFDKYPMGFPSTPVMEFDWRMNMLDDDEIYGDFFEAITNPLKPLNVIDTADAVWAGTTYRMYIDFKSEDDAAAGYREIFHGCQREGKIKASEASDLQEAKVEHMNRCVLDSLLNSIITGDLWEGIIDIMPHISRQAFYELLIPYPVSQFANWGIGHSTHKRESSDVIYHWFFKITDWWSHIELLYQIVYDALLRESTNSGTIDMPGITFYKQPYNYDGSLGGPMTWESIYFIGYITKAYSWPIGDTFGGLLDVNDEMGFHGRYKNGIWDLLSDFFLFGLHKASLTGLREIKSIAPFDFLDYMGDISLDLEKIFDWELVNPDGPLKKATASMFERVESDIDKYEAADTGSRNQDEITIPMVFNNTPAAAIYDFAKNDDYSAPFFIEDGAVSVNSDTNKEHICGLYYKDHPALLSDDIESMFFRVHEHVTVKLASDLWSEDLPNCSLRPYNYVSIQPATGRPTEIALDMQKETCMPRLLSNMALECFKSNRMSGFTFSVDFNEYTHYQEGGDVGFLWWMGEGATFNFDPAAIRARYSFLPKQWVMLSTELDGEKETAKVKLIPRTV